jgi:lactate dehydrogenase-like 2-hydroxyacid dehydrogenase
VDLDACRQRGIRLCNTPDVLTDDVADLAVALVLLTSRRLLEANRFLHAGHWRQGPFPLAAALGGKRAGIVGLGRIGAAIARRLQAFGMHIAYHGRRPQSVPYAYHAELTSLAEASDFLILACPGGRETHHLVNEAVLSALGPEGILINVARGSVVDEACLVQRLMNGQLGGVGLDVLEQEPNVPAGLLDHPRAVLLPHVGSATVETRAAMGRLCLDNLRAHFSGQALLTPVV